MLHLRLFGPAELTSEDGAEIANVLAQPKRLAILTFLAIARPIGFHRRDSLLALFWPELDQDRGRAALRQALYTLRRNLPRDTIVTRGDGEVGINRQMLQCDVAEFSRLRDSDPEAALHHYRGHLLQGFFVNEAPAFERWLDEERERLRREAGQAAWRVAERVRSGDPQRAVAWAHRAVELDPFNEEGLRRLMSLFADAGQRANALQVHQDFEKFLERELETAPSEATQQLAESLRTPPVKRNGNGNGSNGAGYVSATPLPAITPRTRRRVIPAVAAALLILIGVGTYRVISAVTHLPVIAVGEIQGASGDTLTPALRDMIATSLARVEGVQVISNSALLERTHTGDRPPAATAARELGAERLLEGSLQLARGGTYRLTLQWVDLRTGKITPAAETQEHHPFDLVDAATVQVARALDLEPPPLRFASVSTNSFTAYRLYEEGLRAYYGGERGAAQRFFGDAVAEDSAFAIAQWYLSRVTPYPENMTIAALAVRLSRHATDRERLFIRTAWLMEMDDPRTVAAAETLAIRYPAEPDGHLLLGRAKLYRGDFLAAIPHLRRVVHMDTLSLTNPRLRCRACDAMSEIGTALANADSPQAALRFTRSWVTAFPQSSNAWFAHASVLDMNGATDAALRARERAVALPPFNFADQAHSEMNIRAGNFAAADAILSERIRSGNQDMRGDGFWIYALSLRNQRRYEEALRAARGLRYLFPRTGSDAIYAAIAEAQVLLEMGRAQAAAALYDSIARAPFTNTSPARNARAFVGGHARAAEAFFRAGDTVALKVRLSEIERWTPYTQFVHARRQHHYVRGLLMLARGDTISALAELKQAVSSPTHGPLRINYYLARTLIQTGQPRAAIPYLDAALRGPVGGGGYYVTHRELHELAAEAWHAAALPDSAQRHEKWLAGLREYRGQPLAILSDPGIE